jgi:hypothetical protein
MQGTVIKFPRSILASTNPEEDREIIFLEEVTAFLLLRKGGRIKLSIQYMHGITS